MGPKVLTEHVRRFKRLGIKIKTVAPYNHQSFQAEHSIKSLSSILTKHLTGLGESVSIQ